MPDKESYVEVRDYYNNLLEEMMKERDGALDILMEDLIKKNEELLGTLKSIYLLYIRQEGWLDEETANTVCATLRNIMGNDEFKEWKDCVDKKE